MRKTKLEFWKKFYVRSVNLLMLILINGAFYLTWMQKWNMLMNRYFENKGNILISLIYLALSTFFLKTWGGFDVGYAKTINLALGQVFGMICTNFVIYIQIVLMVGDVQLTKKIAIEMITLLVENIVILLLCDIIFVKLYRKIFPPLRILQINGEYKNFLNQKMSARRDKYKICEEISVFKPENEIFDKMNHYDAILLNDIPSEYKNKILKYCFEHSIRVYFTPKISDIIVKGTEEINLFDSPLFLCKNIGLTIGQRVFKRIFDILLSLVGMIITSPFMLVAAICIKIYDGGPVFFKQERCTYGGKVFWIYKFRSMIVDAEKDGKSKPATDDDDRITPVGRFIRKTRIDELPQLLNIFKGDMSIVGPRPERIEHIEKYGKEIPEFTYRLKVKGGLTGYAQVYGKYNTTALDKLKMDLLYIVNYSILVDFQILFETVKIIFQKESTEGFTEGQKQKLENENNAH